MYLIESTNWMQHYYIKNINLIHNTHIYELNGFTRGFLWLNLLDLSYNNVNHIDSNAISKACLLEKLHLNDNKIVKDSVETLQLLFLIKAMYLAQLF